MSPSPEQIKNNYREAYKAFFGTEPPSVRISSNGGYYVRYDGGGKQYTKREPVLVTAMMLNLNEVE